MTISIKEQLDHLDYKKNRSEYVGRIWSDIFSVLSISPTSSIIEIAP